MSVVTDHINVITTKLQQLLRKYDHLLKENNKQLQLITQLQQEQQAGKEMLENLQQQNLLLKASFTSMDEKDKKDLLAFILTCRELTI